MATSDGGLLGRLRQPEYTGENRCTPCTIVNLGIAVVVAGLLALGTLWLGAAVAVGAVVGLLAFAVFAGAIYLRGYLVPGTPEFTKTYFPDWLLRAFEKEPVVLPGAEDDPFESEMDVEAYLTDVGALEECEDVDDLCLTPSFEAAWRERVDSIRRDGDPREDAADVLDVDPERLEWVEYDSAIVAWANHAEVGQWESDAAIHADLAAARALREWDDGWQSLSMPERGSVLNGLRIFLEACPTCGGRVQFRNETVESCCRSIDVLALSCADCGARLLEAEDPTA